MRSIVLFLDFDGVLHPDGSIGGQLFEPGCINALATVLTKFPSVEVVISSSWRQVHSLESLRDMVPALASRIVGCTPDWIERIHLPGELWSFARHGQCWAWMAWNRPSDAAWIALDDQTWRFAPECAQLYLVNGKTGLTSADVNKLSARLATLIRDAGGELAKDEPAEDEGINGQDVSARVRLFDKVHQEALRRLWFVGDIHGTIGPVETALAHAATPPTWLVFAGDIDLSGTPFRHLINQLRRAAPLVKIAFIHGNHDADTHDHWAMLHDAGDALALHGGVHDLDGIVVGGLGGTFVQRVWKPPENVVHPSLAQALAMDTYRWPGQKTPHSSLNAAIFADDVDALASQSADLLVTHEAFSCHPKGFAVLDALARSLGVKRAFHGHQHDDLSASYAAHRDVLGFDAQGLGFCGIKDGLGNVISPHLEGW